MNILFAVIGLSILIVLVLVAMLCTPEDHQ
jgi:hypothetical protein